MSKDYTIATDPARGLLILRLSGFFDPESVARLDAERREALARLGTAPNRHVTLCDVSACKLQAQDIVAAFGRVLADPAAASRRIAFVTGSSLARMQIRRMLSRAGMACFETTAQATAWLFEIEPA